MKNRSLIFYLFLILCFIPEKGIANDSLYCDIKVVIKDSERNMYQIIIFDGMDTIHNSCYIGDTLVYLPNLKSGKVFYLKYVPKCGADQKFEINTVEQRMATTYIHTFFHQHWCCLETLEFNGVQWDQKNEFMLKNASINNLDRFYQTMVDEKFGIKCVIRSYILVEESADVGRKRAEVVKKYLVKKGMPEDLLVIEEPEIISENSGLKGGLIYFLILETLNIEKTEK